MPQSDVYNNAATALDLEAGRLDSIREAAKMLREAGGIAQMLEAGQAALKGLQDQAAALQTSIEERQNRDREIANESSQKISAASAEAMRIRQEADTYMKAQRADADDRVKRAQVEAEAIVAKAKTDAQNIMAEAQHAVERMGALQVSADGGHTFAK